MPRQASVRGGSPLHGGTVQVKGFKPGRATGRREGDEGKETAGEASGPPDFLIGQKKSDVNGNLGPRAADRPGADPGPGKMGLEKSRFSDN